MNSSRTSAGRPGARVVLGARPREDRPGAGAEVVAGPRLGHPHPAGLVRGQRRCHMSARTPPFDVVAANGRSSVIGPVDRAVAIQVAHGHQAAPGALGGGRGSRPPAAATASASGGSAGWRSCRARRRPAAKSASRSASVASAATLRTAGVRSAAAAGDHADLVAASTRCRAVAVPTGPAPTMTCSPMLQPPRSSRAVLSFELTSLSRDAALVKSSALVRVR